MRRLCTYLLALSSALFLPQCVPLMLGQAAAGPLTSLIKGKSLTPGTHASLPSTQPATYAAYPPQSSYVPLTPSGAHAAYSPAVYYPQSVPASYPLSAPRLSPSQQTGWGAYYAEERHGRHTASGEIYDMYGWTAAHPTLPFGSFVRVTNLENGRAITLRVNDRTGHATRHIDVSKSAAQHLGMIRPGVVPLSIRAWEPGYGWQ